MIVEQVDRGSQELLGHCKRVSIAVDGQETIYLLEYLRLPVDCSPAEVDVLLCPFPRDGYPSRLYFAQQINCSFQRNWNFYGIVAGRHWYAFSWKVEPANLTLRKILLGHLEGFTRC